MLLHLRRELREESACGRYKATKTAFFGEKPERPPAVAERSEVISGPFWLG